PKPPAKRHTRPPSLQKHQKCKPNELPAADFFHRQASPHSFPRPIAFPDLKISYECSRFPAAASDNAKQYKSLAECRKLQFDKRLSAIFAGAPVLTN
ncbi:MAG: hypothetical protein ACKPJD_27865, partial [Planctomycetaceae bacterium]